MTKVEELVERVRLTHTETQIAILVGGSREGMFQRVAQAQLNKVLNDPDLALINRELERLASPSGEPKVRYSSLRYVIPLAEALKEVKT